MLSQVYPRNNAVVSGLSPAQKMFLLLSESAARRALRDEDLRRALIKSVGSQPPGLRFSWQLQAGLKLLECHLLLADNPGFHAARRLLCTEDHQLVYNLKLGQAYYWKLQYQAADLSRHESETRRFSLENLAPRLMYVPNCMNFRDLGAYTGLYGQRLKQGMVYRSAALNHCSYDKTSPGPDNFSAEGKAIMLEQLGLKSELDLRSSIENGGLRCSPLGEQLHYFHINVPSYSNIYSAEGMAKYAEVFRVFCEPKNYPINFHCSVGADRSGSLAFLLQALLGVPEHQLAQDYAFTSFFTTRYYELFDQLRAGMHEFGEKEEDLSVKAERYLLKAGISLAEIERFRSLMLESAEPLSSPADFHGVEYYLSQQRRQPGVFSVNPVYALCQKQRFGSGTYDLKLPYWRESPLLEERKTGKGEYLLHLHNRRDDALCLSLALAEQSLAEQSFCISEPLHQRLYLRPDGERFWSAEQLGEFSMSLEPQSDRLLRLSTFEPESRLQPCQPPALNYDPRFIDVQVNPELSGYTGEALPEAFWRLSPEREFNVLLEGHPETKPHVRLAIDPEQTCLFIRVFFPDRKALAWPSAAGLDPYRYDLLKLYLAGILEEGHYELVFDRNGKSAAKNTRDKNWDLQDYTLDSETIKEGWLLRLALPLQQFYFKNAVEFNLGCEDFPPRILYNLADFNRNFNDRESMRPIRVRP